MKNWNLAVLILMLMVSLSACREDDDPQDVTTQSQLTDNSVNTELAGEIEFVNWMVENPGLADRIIEKFNEEYPNIEVISTEVPFIDMRKTIIAAYASGMSADVYQLNMPWGKELVNIGVLEPLDEYIENDETFEYESLVQEPMKPIDGHIYMIPISVMHFVLYCNTDHFMDAGIDFPDTWEELEAAANALTDIENNRYGFSMSMSSVGAANGPILTLYPLLYSAGGRTIRDGKPNVDTPEMKKLLHMIDRMYADGSIMPGTLTKSGIQVVDEFAAGLTSMMIEPSTHMKTVNNRNQSLNFDVVRVPGPEDNSIKATRLHGIEAGISSESQNKLLAWTFIKFLVREDINAWLSQELGEFPANLKADTAYIFEDDLLRKAYELMEGVELVEELMMTPKSTDTWRVFTDYVQKMLLDEIEPDEAARSIQIEWEAIFEE